MKPMYQLASSGPGAQRDVHGQVKRKAGYFCILVCLLVMTRVLALAQEMTIRGKVTDASDGHPLPGVNVLVKGTNQGTITDTEGAYTLATSVQTPTLIFSFVGMQTQEVEVGQLSVIDVGLQQDVRQLSEIVVTGTGVPTEKRKLAFAVESVSAEKLPIVPTTSIDQALVGRIPGAQISSINGTPGSEISILLRGINTINRGTTPMILVDGVQMGATTLSSIDPNSIEKVEVIQGAAAGTIYGAQGANGVIQMFTKQGKKGKMKFDFSAGATSSEFLNIGGLRKAQLHAFTTNTNNEVINPGNGSPLIQDPSTLVYNGDVGYNALDTAWKTNKAYDQNLKYVDHFKMFFKPALTYTSRIGISGGGDKMDYNISLSKMRQESNFIGDGYNDRTNLTLNLGTELAEGLRLRSITQLIYNHNTINVFEKQDFGFGANFFPLLLSRPFADFSKKDLDGNYGADFGQAASINQYNPFYQYQYSSTLDKKVDVLQNFNLSYKFSRHFDVELLYGLNYQTRNVRHIVQNQSLNKNSNSLPFNWSGWSNNVNNTGEVTVVDDDRTFQNVKATAFLHFDFANDFKWGIPLKSSTQIAYDYRSDQLNRYRSYALGMPVVPPLTAQLGTTFNIPEDYREEFVTIGYLVNQRFEYEDIAGISGGFRSDYSSSFGRGSKPFTFPRADGFFRISSLNFWDKAGLSKRILEWKVRAAYGEAGIQPRPFDRYVTLNSRALGTTNALFFGAAQSNPDLDVEVSREFEAGSDIMVEGFKGIWLRNAQISVSYWDRTTDNSIFRVDAPPSSGVGTVLENAISLASNGIQASVVASMLRSSKLRWDLTLNFSKQRSYIEQVNGGGEIIAGNRILRAGEAVGQMYGRLLLHSIDEKNPNGEPFIDPSLQSNYEVASNGWVVNKSSKQPYLTTERYSLGDPNPSFMMTMIQDLSHRQFITFSFQLDWLNGNHVYNDLKQWMYRDGVHSDYEKPIAINGESGAWTAFYRGAYTPNPWEKNYFYEDASFVRLRNISIGVDFARLFGMKINKLQVVLSGRNLWTYTKYTGMDPEISTYGADNRVFGFNTTLNRGVDSGTQPNLRAYQFTINIGL